MLHPFRPHLGAQVNFLLIHHEVLANSPKCNPSVIMAVNFKVTFDVLIILQNRALALGYSSSLC